MMGFELPLFPTGALDSSVITTVWVGVCVVALLNLRFGTTMAGLVVPGYLVPLLIAKPASAVITVIEALLTYFLARFCAEWAMRRLGAAEMFGRDRFFAVLLISVLVRVVGDGWVLPEVGDWLATKGLAFDYQSSLNSFGLIVVALIANQMWNGGPVRGLIAFSMYVGITFLIVRLVLMPFTNFSLGGLTFMYEDVATNILSSPKSYIILLTTAFIASRLNVNFGWEFGGIVIPALLAMQWYQPWKVIGTFLEAFIILGFGRLALRLPVLSKMNMEGARILLLYFNVGFLYKALLGLALGFFAPELKVSDYYAFGYLLSTLVAVKMHQKEYLFHMTSTTLKTSVGAVCIATVIGFAMTQWDQFWFRKSESMATAAPRLAVAGPEGDAARAVIALKAELYRSENGNGAAPTSLELDQFRRALTMLRNDLSLSTFDNVDAAFAEVGYSVVPLAAGQLLLVDMQPQRGFGMFVLNPHARRPVLVEVPAPLDEIAVLEAAAHLYQSEGYLALAIAGRRNKRSDGRGVDVLTAADSFMMEFQRAFGAGGVVQVRRMEDGDGQATRLYVKRELPDALSVTSLRRHLGPIAISWAESPVQVNRLREAMESRFAELYVSSGRLRAVIAAGQSGSDAVTERPETFVARPLQQSLREQFTRLAPLASEGYVKPDLSDLLFLDNEVVRPLLALAARAGRLTQRDYEQELVALADVASVKGYAIWQQTDVNHDARYLFLADRDARRVTRGWGTLVLRLAPQNDTIIEVPRPLAEYGAFEYAVALFARTGARALLIAGAHPEANIDGSADVLKLENSRSFFQLLHERLLASSAGNAQVLQARMKAILTTETVPDIVLAYEEGGPVLRAVESAASLLALLQQDGATIEFADGRRSLVEFKPSRNAQSLIIRIEPQASFTTLWLSRLARESYAYDPMSPTERKGLEALGIRSQSVSLEQWQASCPGSATISATYCSALAGMAKRFATTRDIAGLQSLVAADPLMTFTHIQDSISGQGYLAACRSRSGTGKSGAAFVASLNTGRSGAISKSAIDAASLRALRETRHLMATATPDCRGG
jgi:gamma-polyglutamate biosynthesis protein CapC